MAKLWDFALGVLLIGSLPMVMFVLVMGLGTLIKPDPNGTPDLIGTAMVFAAAFTLPLATLVFVCRWRKTHRRLPVSFLWIEVLLGLVTGAAYFVYLVAMWGFASIN